MVKLYLIQTGPTTLEADGRMDPATGAPLTPEGARSARQMARELAETRLSAIYTCDGPAEQETAKLLAKPLKVKVRTDPSLRELDYGLWQALTRREIKRRQPHLYKRWSQSPASVRLPGGETLAEAQQRLGQALKAIAKHRGNGPVALVLRPVALGLLRCLFDHSDVAALWRHVDPKFTWGTYEVDTDSL